MGTILIAIILATVLFSFKGFNDEAFFRKFEFHIGSIKSGDKIRMISSGFLHADFGHLFFNLFSLYMFAPIVIDYFGSSAFFIIYMGSLFGGSLLTYQMHKNDYNYRAIGASGAVMGIIYSAILIEPSGSIYVYFIKMPSVVFGIGYLLYSIYGMKSKSDNIGHTAHFGGAIAGYLITLIKDPAMLTSNTLMVGLLAIPIIILFGMSKTGNL
jgi:membrane associated rhomboid family serine protease